MSNNTFEHEFASLTPKAQEALRRRASGLIHPDIRRMTADSLLAQFCPTLATEEGLDWLQITYGTKAAA